MNLKEIEISRIDPNPDNPRGINIQSQDPKLSYLKDSIKQFGVMVPVVVTPVDGRYRLIDGERRFYAARAVGLTKLPAFVITSTDGGPLSPRDVLFRMFQIHHLREQWGPVQQCAALEATYNQIIRRKDIRGIANARAWISAVSEKLAAETGIEERTALDRVKFLRWPGDVKDRLYDDPNPKFHLAVRTISLIG